MGEWVLVTEVGGRLDFLQEQGTWFVHVPDKELATTFSSKQEAAEYMGFKGITWFWEVPLDRVEEWLVMRRLARD